MFENIPDQFKAANMVGLIGGLIITNRENHVDAEETLRTIQRYIEIYKEDLDRRAKLK